LARAARLLRECGAVAARFRRELDDDASCSSALLPDQWLASAVKDRRDHDDLRKDAVEDGVGGEREHAAPPNVSVDLRVSERRFCDRLEHGAELEEETDREARIDRILAIPNGRLVYVSLRGSADLVPQADRRPGLCLSSSRAMTSTPFCSVPVSSRSRRSSSLAIHHPLRERCLVSLNGLELLRVLAHVVGQGVRQCRGKRLPPLESLGGEP
jgi:hypothetical protein